MKRKLNKHVLPAEVRMQTETIFATNGIIHTTPCSFEEQEVHYGNQPVKQRGSCWIEPDGTTTFRPFRHSGKKAFETIYDDEVAQVRLYRTFAEMRIRFAYDCGTQESLEFVQAQLDIAKSTLLELYPEGMRE